jgi:hypothetical protein
VVAALSPNELAPLLVDTANVYGPDPATDTYDVLLLTFQCRVSPRTTVALGTGVGPVRVSYFHVMYPADIVLPDGYWEIEVAGVRYAPQANSSSPQRDVDGNILWRRVDVDQLGYSPH